MEGVSVEAGPFDRDFNLDELLDGKAAGALTSALSAMLGTAVCLRNGRDKVVAGECVREGVRLPVRGSLEPIGSLEARAPRAALEGAVFLVERLVRAELRYRMASSLHTAAIHADFAALQEKHAALQESERRYRELNEGLEARVKEQVVQLDTAQRQLYQAEKLASVGQLAAGLAHEINTPIGFVHSNLNTAQEYCRTLEQYYRDTSREGRPEIEELFGDFRALLGESLDGTQRVARIVAALKDFSQVDRQEMRVADLNEVIRNAVEMVRPQGNGRIDFAVDLSPLPAVACNAGQMGQLVLNLLSNAVQAVEGRGRVRVQSNAAADSISIVIEDDGVGIAAENLSRIFDPFFTTKGVGRGTGLGLTVSNDIVRAHGGRIEVTSRVGAGTRAAVFLPLGGARGA